MKNLILMFLFGTLLIMGCIPNKKEKAEALFTDPVMQDEIFNAILNDTSRLQDFFEMVHKQRKGYGPMHQQIMGKVCCDLTMDSIMMCNIPMQRKMMRHLLMQSDQDSIFCQQLGDSVLKHDRLRKHLKQRMEPGRQVKRGNR